jgi:hypothetical protein
MDRHLSRRKNLLYFKQFVISTEAQRSEETSAFQTTKQFVISTGAPKARSGATRISASTPDASF